MLSVQAEYCTIHFHHFLDEYQPHLPKLSGFKGLIQTQKTIQIDSPSNRKESQKARLFKCFREILMLSPGKEYVKENFKID